MKNLVINAHPDFNNLSHFSQKLLESFKEKFNPQDLKIINLYELDIPRLDSEMMEAWANVANN